MTTLLLTIRTKVSLLGAIFTQQPERLVEKEAEVGPAFFALRGAGTRGRLNSPACGGVVVLTVASTLCAAVEGNEPPTPVVSMRPVPTSGWSGNRFMLSTPSASPVCMVSSGGSGKLIPLPPCHGLTLGVSEYRGC